VSQLINLRRQFPQLRPRYWLSGDREGRAHDVMWLTPSGAQMQEPDWNFPDGHFLSYVLAPTTEDGIPLFIVLNVASEPIEFVLPEWSHTGHWNCLLDTAAFPQPPNAQRLASGARSSSAPSSVMVFSGERV
jgi:glycogen operon protein